MFKRILSGFLVFIFFLLLANPISAQLSSPAPVPEKVNSYELFWPMSAGKTVESKLYFLKAFKENVRGWLIFGKSPKAKYHVFLGTKRVLEAESLLIVGKKDLVNVTLDRAKSLFESASENIDKAKEEGKVTQDAKDEINTRSNNLKKLLTWLATQYPDNKDKLNEILESINKISTKI